MRRLKDKLRQGFSYAQLHGSMNVEESLMVFDAFPQLEPRPHRKQFKSLKDFFFELDKYMPFVYVVQRSFDDLESQIGSAKDIDILVNDYYFFKSATGALSNNKRSMRSNDDGMHIQNTVRIHNSEVIFDVRFIGDNHYPKDWQHHMLSHRKRIYQKDFSFYIPNDDDLYFSLMYYILIHKSHSNFLDSCFNTYQHGIRVKGILRFRTIC